MKLPSFKKEKSFRKGGFHTNPDICWEIVLYVAFAIVLGILVFGFYLFQKVNDEFTIPNLNANTQYSSVNRSRLDKVLQYFSTRDAKSVQILTSPAPFVDPSL